MRAGTARTAGRTIATASTRPSIVSQTFVRCKTTTFVPEKECNWQPALPAGVNPAYDAALEYLAQHRKKCDAKLEAYREIQGPTQEEVIVHDNLEVDGFVNDPATRALFNKTRGVGYMDRPVIRHLAERRWRKKGGLDLVMGRIYQNKVVPDVFPDMPLVQPLSIRVEDGGLVEPGLCIPAEKLEKPPVLNFQPFQHPAPTTPQNANPEAMYTLVCVDADLPDPEAHTYTQRLHYLRTDIPLSVVSGEVDLLSADAGGTEWVPWEAVCPARGTKKHRYIFALFRQGSQSKLDYAPPRENFNVRSLMATYNLPINHIVGVNLVRSEWTDESRAHIDRIWRQVHGGYAPHFRLDAKEERYPRPLTPLQKRGEALRQRAWDRSVEEFAREIGADIVDKERV